jgi:lipopolysaccharide biosynthesis glycosyltransferase
MPHLADLHRPHPYFNSGMMLLNLQQWREDNMEEKAMAFGKEHVQRLPFADQDILNVVFGGNVVYLPLKWNCVQNDRMTFFPYFNRTVFYFIGWRFAPDYFVRLREAERSPCIIHYSNTKPWDGGCNSPLAKEYWKYAVQTPFYEQIRFSWRRIFRNILNGLLLGAYPIVYYLLRIRKR